MKNKQNVNNICVFPCYLSTPAFAYITIPQAWIELKAQHKTCWTQQKSIPEASSSIISLLRCLPMTNSSSAPGARPCFIHQECAWVLFVWKWVLLTIGHEGHYGVGGATQVGRGTFIGYDPKQSNRPIRGEPKHSSQSQNPQLSKLKSETGSVNLTTVRNC